MRENACAALTAVLSVALGIGLAAATGFRIFLPLLIAGIAARSGWITLNDTFAWLATTPALIALGTAAFFEILAYYIPGVDHVLDVIAGPAAAIAGVVLLVLFWAVRKIAQFVAARRSA